MSAPGNSVVGPSKVKVTRSGEHLGDAGEHLADAGESAVTPVKIWVTPRWAR